MCWCVIRVDEARRSGVCDRWSEWRRRETAVLENGHFVNRSPPTAEAAIPHGCRVGAVILRFRAFLCHVFRLTCFTSSCVFGQLPSEVFPLPYSCMDVVSQEKVGTRSREGRLSPSLSSPAFPFLPLVVVPLKSS